MATMNSRRSTGACAWCPSPTTRSSTPGTPWAWRRPAARTSRCRSCSYRSAGPCRSGAAEGAYELFLETMAKRAGTYTGARVADFQAVQIKVARARCLIDSARDFLRQSAIGLQAAAQRDEAPDLETKLRFRAPSAFAVNQSREAVETLWSCYGAQGLYVSDPLQRHLRDVLAINQHFSFNFDIAGAAYGLHALGGRYANPTM